MSSGQEWGTAIGFVVGAYFGNPQLGAMIGGMIGGAIDPTTIRGPRIGEIDQQTAAEGSPRPIVFARSQPMPGNVLFDSEIEKIYTTESGKGGPEVETESLYRTYAIGVCEGPGVVLLQVWRNGQLVFDLENPSMTDDNAEFMRYARWFNGAFDQMPSPDLEAKAGVGNVHAHRGLAYIVFRKDNVTDTRGSWNQWQFRVGRYTDYQEGRWWGVSLSENTDPTDRFLWRSTQGIEFGPREYRGPPNTQLYTGSNVNTLARTPEGDMLLFGSEGVVERYVDFTQEVLPAPIIETIYADNTGLGNVRAFENCVIATVNAANRYHVRIDGVWGQYEVPGGLALGDINQLKSGRWIGFIYASSNQSFIYSDSEYPTGGWVVATTNGVIPSNTDSEIAVVGDKSFYVGSAGRVYRALNGDSWEEGGLGEINHNGGGSLVVGDTVIYYDVNSNVIYVSTAAGEVGTFVAIDVGQGNRNIDYGNGLYVASGADFTNRYLYSTDALAWETHLNPSDEPSGERNFLIGYAEPLFDYKEGFYPLALIIQELCNRVNAGPYIGIAELADYQCRGFTTTNSYPCYSALEELSRIFFFQPSNQNGIVRFIPLGADSVATITEENLIDDGEDIDEDNRRGDSVNVPRVLHLNYRDIQGGLNLDKQRSERPEGSRAVGEQSMSTPVVLSADEAAAVIVKSHAMMVEQLKGELKFSLPDNWLFLTETDPVILQYRGRSVRAFIKKVMTDDGYQGYEALRDRQSIYTMDVEGLPPAVVTPPPSRRIGPTLLQIIDGGPLNDLDDVPGFYVALTGLYPAWQGALVELSLDGGETYIDRRVVQGRSVIGTTVSVLGDHPQEYPDQTNSVTVAIQTPEAELESTDLAGLLNQRNLAIIGNEMLQFGDAVETTDGVWDLSYFIRGRKGTDTQEHPLSSRFVLLNNVFFVPAQYAWIGRDLTFRATSLGTSIEDATITTVTFQSRNQIERKVGYLTAVRSDDDLLICWQQVGRLGAGVNANTGNNFIGSVVTVTDGVSTSTIRNTGQDALQEYRVPLAGFTGPITVTARQRNRYTNLGPPVTVIYANP